MKIHRLVELPGLGENLQQGTIRLIAAIAVLSATLVNLTLWLR